MVDALFSSVDSAKEKTELCIKLSYFEIYNEKLQDLLKPENDNLPVHERKGSPYVKVVVRNIKNIIIACSL